MLEYCTQQNIAFIPWFPIGGGMDAKSEETLQRIANENSATLHHTALSWLLHRADNILLIPGTSNLTHLEENMKASAVELSEQDMAELDNL